MPRISDRFIDCVAYVYPTEIAAYEDAAHGGTGFLYGIPVSEGSSDYRVFVVTCRHVLRGGDVFIRMNTQVGGYKVIPIPAALWKIDPTEDIAAAPIAADAEFKPAFVRSDWDVAGNDLLRRMNLGPGDDVFVVGRFAPLGGQGHNAPVVRFGCIAMMPYEPVYNSQIGLETLCYLVDLRVRKGFSGSPVFVQYANRISVEGSERSGPWSGELLLGICWGAFEVAEQIRHTGVGAGPAEYSVSLPEGLACVAPSSRVDSLVRQWAA